MLPPPLHRLPDPSTRHRLLDALRGFALLGILLMNIEWFSRWLLDQSLRIDPGAGPAGIAAWLVYVCVQGKFWLLFATLFGVGFALMQERLEADGRPFVRIQCRRSLALIGFGLLHALLLWPGDVLMLYGLSALLLLAFRRLPGTVLWLTGLGLYLGVVLYSLAVGWLLGWLPAEVMTELAGELSPGAARIAAVEAIYRDGSFLAVTAQRLRDLGELVPVILFGQLPMALGSFLLGVWLWRSGPLRTPGAHRRFWVRMLIAGALLGVPLLTLSLSIGTQLDMATEPGTTVLAQSWMMLASLPLGLLWLSAFVLLWQSAVGARVLGLLAPAGRMALTHYLAQSLICSLLFFGYGLGWYGQLDRLEQVLLALAICTAQWLVSPLWLSAFQYGPMEWLWRALSYGEWPRFRRSAAVSTGW
jgi:uncharacterized protein